jgi:hypothetical protein
MTYLYLVVSCIVFIELFIALKIKRQAHNLISESRETMGVMMSPEIGDDEKEAFMRRAALKMLIATILFAGKFLLIVLALSTVFWLSVTIFPELQEPIMESFVSPAIIVGLTVLAVAYAWARNVVFK